MRWQLLDGGELELWPDFIPKTEQLELLAALTTSLPWRQREIQMFGRAVLEPRETAWIGDPGAVYTYSGRVNDPTPWPSALSELRVRVSARASEAFNCVLCNLYRDGSDSMGLHADAERELGENPVIGSVSLGAVRRFQLRHRKQREAKLDLDLPSGSLLIMRGTTQRHYRHGIPKQLGVSEPRVNLTFRRVLAGSPDGASLASKENLC
jgi:alkylated DNA repair dioxygenase AlkB